MGNYTSKFTVRFSACDLLKLSVGIRSPSETELTNFDFTVGALATSCFECRQFPLTCKIRIILRKKEMNGSLNKTRTNEVKKDFGQDEQFFSSTVSLDRAKISFAVKVATNVD